MTTVFTPSHKSLFSLFEPGTVYVIPSYQRPYSWQALGKSDRNNQVNQMWDDLWDFFEDGSLKQKEYFLGSMVLIERQRAEFEVIDGQQRLTTVTLLFAAMRCFLNALTSSDSTREFIQDSIATLDKHLYNRQGIGLVKHLKVKIGQESGYNYQGALTAAIECRTPELVAGMSEDERKVSARYAQNRDFFSTRVNDKFLTQGSFTEADANRFDEFYKFLSHRVSLVLIMTTDFETAYSIFEILNNRGLPLTGRDLLRNFLIKEMSAAGLEDPPAAWTELERDYALTEDFIGRWVESTGGQKQQYSAFNDALKIYDQQFRGKPGQPAAFRFYSVLRADLDRYSRIVEADQRLDSKAIANKLQAVRSLGNERYSGDLILALFRACNYLDGDDPQVLGFLSAYQRWVWHTILTPGVRFASGPVFASIRHLQTGNFPAALEQFRLTSEQSQNLRGAIQGKIEDHEVARLLLATYVWWEQARVSDVTSQRLHLREASLEHICPQQPEGGTNWLLDFSPQFRQDFGRRLGNMTLLTVKMNAAAKNRDFAYKRKHYEKTLLPMTRELAQLDSITEPFFRARHERIVAGIIADLGL